jgi:pyruvate,water dikinase
MAQMAGLAEADPVFVKTLSGGSLAEIMVHMPCLPEFEAQYRAYLERFGERCLEELKLESPTLHDDPLPLLRGVGQLAQNLERPEGRQLNWKASRSNRSPSGPSFYPRDQAKTQVDAALAGRPLRAWLFHWVLENARRLIRNRENLRFERTRLFGRARMIFVELGRRFQVAGWLAEPRDIFYLEVEEVLGMVEGTISTTDLQSLVAVRRAEFERYQRLPPLPNRFETRGIPYQRFRGNAGEILEPSPVLPKLDRLQGLGCSPGVVRGPVRLVRNPKGVQLKRGEILVAERTDPGWIMLFPAAAGLLVEYGSLLSHSAIVSRELGLPAIVSLSGITRWLNDGDWVEFDGSSGLVTRLERPDD